MGCDIHLHTEVKINGEWQHYSVCHVTRNYALFALMADVRNDGSIEPVSLQKGLPMNMTPLTKFDYQDWKLDAHSSSWLTASEIKELHEKCKELNIFKYDRSMFGFSDSFGYLFGNDWSGFIKYPDERLEGLEDVRFIFWFDN